MDLIPTRLLVTDHDASATPRARRAGLLFAGTLLILSLVGAGCGDEPAAPVDTEDTTSEDTTSEDTGADVTDDTTVAQDTAETDDTSVDTSGPDASVDTVGPDGSDSTEPACPPGTEDAGDECVACPAGSFGDGSVCTPCPQGTVQPGTGQAECAPCGLGYFDDGTEACVDIDECVTSFPCPDCVNIDGSFLCLGKGAVVNDTGGSLMLDNFVLPQTELMIPPGALPGSLKLGMGLADRAIDQYPYTSVSLPVQFLPSPMVFNEPVEVSMQFDPTAMPVGCDASDVRIISRNDETGESEVLMPTSVDMEAGVVVFDTISFSTKEIMVIINGEEYLPVNATCETDAAGDVTCTCDEGFEGSPPETECLSTDTSVVSFTLSEVGDDVEPAIVFVTETEPGSFTAVVGADVAHVTIAATMSTPGTLIEGPGELMLNVGEFDATYTVTALSGATDTVTLTVRRQSSDTTLSNLKVTAPGGVELDLVPQASANTFAVGPIMYAGEVVIGGTIHPDANAELPRTVVLDGDETTVDIQVVAEDPSFFEVTTVIITQCPQGNSLDGDTCVPCPAGSRPDGQGGCIACPAGSYAPEAGLLDCLPCDCDQANVCTEAPVCDPVQGCVATPMPAGTVCGDPSDTSCSRPDTCDGAGACQPNHEPDDTPCGVGSRACKAADFCVDGACVQGELFDSSVLCGDERTNGCTLPDTCDGAGGCASNHIDCDCPSECANHASTVLAACEDHLANNPPPVATPANFCDALVAQTEAACVASACDEPVDACNVACGAQGNIVEEECNNAVNDGSWCESLNIAMLADCQAELPICPQLPDSCEENCFAMETFVSEQLCHPREGVGPPLRPVPSECGTLFGGASQGCVLVGCQETPAQSCSEICEYSATTVYDACLGMDGGPPFPSYCDTMRERALATCLLSDICDIADPTVCIDDGEEVCDGRDNDCNGSVDDIPGQAPATDEPVTCALNPLDPDPACELGVAGITVEYDEAEVCFTVADPAGCDGQTFTFTAIINTDGAGQAEPQFDTAAGAEQCTTLPFTGGTGLFVAIMPESECTVPPELTISATLQGATCPAPCVPTGVEVCDGVDNDCDGFVDGAVCNANTSACDAACDEHGEMAADACAAFIANNPPSQAMLDNVPPPFADTFCAIVAGQSAQSCRALCSGPLDDGTGFDCSGELCTDLASMSVGALCPDGSADPWCAGMLTQLGADCSNNFGYCQGAATACGSEADCDDGDPCTRDLCQPGSATRTYLGGVKDNVDTNPASTHTFTITDAGTITDLDVELTIAPGDQRARELSLSLSHGGVTVVLHNSVRNPVYVPESPRPTVVGIIDATFDDEATATIPAAPDVLTSDLTLDVVGAVQTDGIGLDAFNGMDLSGEWTLRIHDPGNYPNDGDALTHFALVASTFRGTCASEPRTAGLCGELQPVTNPDNGHRYAVVNEPLATWQLAKTAAENLTYQGVRGHLVTITSAEEQAFLDANITWGRYWLGGFQNRAESDYVEPDGGWRWTTSEDYSYTNYATGQPNEFNDLGEDYLASDSSGGWKDEQLTWSSLPGNEGFIVEFSGTCVPEPEICDGRDNDCDDATDEDGVCTLTLGPVQNPINGHWYEIVPDAVPGWGDAVDAAAARSHMDLDGHLATITSAREQSWIMANMLVPADGVWLGGSQDPASPDFGEPDGGFSWITEEPFAFANYAAGEPDDVDLGGPGADALILMAEGGWVDAGQMPAGILVEYGTPPPGGPCDGITCDDGDACTIDTCQPVAPCVDGEGPTDGACYVCVHDAAAPNAIDVCNGVDDDCDGTVDNGPNIATECDDGNACTTDLCGGTLGCINTSDIDCNDGILCTLDSCDPLFGCTHALDDSACNDGLGCSLDRCDAVEGCVHEPQDALCSDLQPCTTDSCSLSEGCVHVADNSACDDGVACTTDVCTALEGCSSTPDDTVCSDGNGCTSDVCDASTGCQNPPLSVPCDDGDPCTVNDVCVDGQCAVGTAKACDDGDVCTLDYCDAATGGCAADPIEDCIAYSERQGRYDGTVQISGELEYRLPTDSLTTERLGSYVCTGQMRFVYDERDNIGFEGLGQTRLACTTTDEDGISALVTRELHPAYVFYATHEDGYRGLFGVDWSPGSNGAYFVNKSVDEAVWGANTSGETTLSGSATMYLGNYLAIMLDGNEERWRSGSFLPTTATFALTKTSVVGRCCGPESVGCEDLPDTECRARGWEWSAFTLGTCTYEGNDYLVEWEKCPPPPWGTFVGGDLGACCRDALCDETSALVCSQLDGAFSPGGSCGGVNDNGFSDACGVPADYGRNEPTDCSYDDQGMLVCDVGQVVELELSGEFTPAADGASFAVSGDVGVPTPAGELVLPGVSGGSVDLSGAFDLTGQAGIPIFGDLEGVLSGLGIIADQGSESFSLSYKFGYEIHDLGIELPVNDGVAYILLQADDGAPDVQYNDAIALEPLEANAFDLVFDPSEPALAVVTGGAWLELTSGGLIEKAGFGLSPNGTLTMRSALPLPDATGKLVDKLVTGHVWYSAAISLQPLVGLPFYVEGEIIVDASTALDAIGPIAESLITQDAAPLVEHFANTGGSMDELDDLIIAGNANTIGLEAGPLEMELGNATWHIEGGRLSFAGSEAIPSLAPKNGDLSSDDLEFLELLDTFNIKRSTGFHGFVDTSGDFSITISGDIRLGPFTVEGASITIDNDGVMADIDGFDFDLVAFARQLAELQITCTDGPVGTAVSCSVGSFEIGSFALQRKDGGLELELTLSLPVFGSATVSGVFYNYNGGTFTLWGKIEAGIPGLVSSDLNVSLGTNGIGLSSVVTTLATTVALSGELGFDGQFLLTGDGGLTIAGYTLGNAEFTLKNSGFSASGRLNLGSFGGVEVDVDISGPNSWSLTGTGGLNVFGHQLADVSVSGSSATGSLSASGEVDLHITKVRLAGQLSPSNSFFEATLGADNPLNIGGYELPTATVRLNQSEGLFVTSTVNVLGKILTLTGQVQPNGDFAFTSTGNASVPIGGITLNMSAKLQKSGSVVSLGGEASGSFLGLGFNSNFSVATNGNFEFAGRANLNQSIDIGITTLSFSGSVDVSVSKHGSHFGFSAAFHGGACASTLFGDVCLSVGASIDSSGRICAEFPVAGYQCVNL